MAAHSLKPEGTPDERRPNPLVYIRQKLERVLHTRQGAVTSYRTEVVSILDTLDAVNRDALGLRRRLHLGEHDVD